MEMMRRFKRVVLWTSVVVMSSVTGQTTPEGLWMSFDDGKIPTAMVRLTQVHGEWRGRIEKVLDPQTSANALCTQCPRDRKNQPMVGLEIVRGDKILDPDDGEEYRLTMALQPNGQVLEVKGHWGLFWRTQYWRRQGN